MLPRNEFSIFGWNEADLHLHSMLFTAQTDSSFSLKHVFKSYILVPLKITLAMFPNGIFVTCGLSVVDFIRNPSSSKYSTCVDKCVFVHWPGQSSESKLYWHFRSILFLFLSYSEKYVTRCFVCITQQQAINFNQMKNNW